MKNRIHIPATRASLTATANHNARWFAGLLAGATALHAADWNGSVDTDWNNPANWTGAQAGSPAVINLATGNLATITSDVAIQPVGVIVGREGATGWVRHLGGLAQTTSAVELGVIGGTGRYDLAGDGGAPGQYTGLPQGTGSLQAGNLHIGKGNGTTSGGTFNMNTSGSLAIAGDFQIGGIFNNVGGTATGVFNLDAGTVTSNNWTEVGNWANSTGTLNISGGSLTKNGANHLIIGANGGKGRVNQTGGSLHSNNDIWVGNSGGEGLLSEGVHNLDAGTVSCGGWLIVGRDRGTGTLNINDGSLSVGGYIIVGDIGGTGKLVQNGGSISVGTQIWIGQQHNGEPTSKGTYELNGGSISNNSWVAIGRRDNIDHPNTGEGTVNMTGGTWTKTGDGNFIIGASGAGTMNVSGGLVDVQSGITWIGERWGASGSLTLSGDAEFRTNVFHLAVNADATGALHLNGGTARTRQITGGLGPDTVNFNGTQIIATGDHNAFIGNLDNATIAGGGLKVDSNGFSLSTPQVLTGPGGVVKAGAGSLALLGASDYTGDHLVEEGILILGNESLVTSNIAVADGAGLGVASTWIDSQVSPGNVTFGEDTSFQVAYGEFYDTSTAPLHVTGTLTLNGDVAVNMLSDTPLPGSIPVLSYENKTGPGGFVLGTLPLGVTATLEESAGLVSLNIISVSLPMWEGSVDGSDNGNWDTTTGNWRNLATGLSGAYADGDPVLFDDFALGTTDVILNGTVAPGSVTFNNDIYEYTLSGAGKITGGGGLLKRGGALLSLATANDYTGPTRLEGGVTSISSIANGGATSSIGASSAAPGNLVLAGGMLEYTGPAASIDRGFTVAGEGSGIRTNENLTISGPVVGTAGAFVKEGPGTLAITHGGENVFTAAGRTLINEGTLLLDGTAGGQSNFFSGETWTTGSPGNPAHLTLVSTSLTTGLWLSIGVGSGNGGVSNFTATDSSIQTASLSTGYNNGNTENESTQNIVVTDSQWTSGTTFLAESPGSTTTMTLDNSSYTGGETLLARFVNTNASLILENGSSFVANGNLIIGRDSGSRGFAHLKGGTALSSSGWLVIGNLTDSEGEVIVDGGTLNQTGTDQELIVGEDGKGTLTVNSGSVNSAGGALNITTRLVESATGVVNLNGGTITARCVSERGESLGHSTFNFNGGVLRAAADSHADFMFRLDVANILAGGAFIDTNGRDITISQPLQGAGALTKQGGGTLTLSGANSYTGSTTVSAGTLSLGGDARLADTATVTVANGATLHLAHGQDDLVAGLTIHGVTYADTTLVAGSVPGLTGSGSITVGTPTGTSYDDWAAANGLSGAQAAWNADGPDQDGILNILEYILGGDPKVSDAGSGILPEAVIEGGDFVFTFNRSDLSETDTTLVFQWGSNLTGWTDVLIGPGNSTTGNVAVGVAENGAAPDAITVRVPLTNAQGGKLFGRLNATKP